MKNKCLRWIALSLAIGIFGVAVPEVLHAEGIEDNTIATQETNETTKDLYSSQYGAWIQINGRYCFQMDDGTYAQNGIYTINGIDYAFDQNGWMVTGWYLQTWDDGTTDWYYFNSDGSMYYGWLQSGESRYYFDEEDGYMYADTFEYIGDGAYQFRADGTMVIGWYLETWDDGTTDWYYHDADGKMHYGWLQDGNTWYYMHPDEGWMITNTELFIDDNYYRFNTDGTMFTGWYQDGDEKCYYAGNGLLIEQWLELDGSWYFFDGNGHMYFGATYRIGDDMYHFDKDGKMVTGWYSHVWTDGDTDWYYFDSDGKQHFGWLQLDSSWYYFDLEEGLMASDCEFEIDGNQYKFNPNGTMVTGWIQEQNDWYYFAENGAMQKGWIQLDNTWYYMDEDDGYMYYDCWHTLNGSTYRFNANGAMQVGWYQHFWNGNEDFDWYYYDANGVEHHGWLTLGSKKYYMHPTTGEMYYSRTAMIDGVYYTFNADGTVNQAI